MIVEETAKSGETGKLTRVKLVKMMSAIIDQPIANDRLQEIATTTDIRESGLGSQ
jgi:hypothetical protein